jgi:hypothetical protein
MRPIIFIGGYPRSGTTFLRRLLSQHPNIVEFNTDNSILNIESKVLKYLKKSTVSFSDIEKILCYDTFTKYPFKANDFTSYFESKTRVSYKEFFVFCVRILLSKYPDKTLLFKSPGLEFYFLELLEMSQKLNLSAKFFYSLRHPLDVYKSYKYSSFAWHGKHEEKSKVDSFVFTWKNSISEYLFAKEYLQGDLFLFRFNRFFQNRDKAVEDILNHLNLDNFSIDWDLLREKQQSSIVSNSNAALTEYESLTIQSALKKEILVFFGITLENRWPRLEDYYWGVLQSIPLRTAVMYYKELFTKKAKRIIKLK